MLTALKQSSGDHFPPDDPEGSRLRHLREDHLHPVLTRTRIAAHHGRVRGPFDIHGGYDRPYVANSAASDFIVTKRGNPRPIRGDAGVSFPTFARV